MFTSRRAVKAVVASAASVALAVVGLPGTSSAVSTKVINFPNFKKGTTLSLNGSAAIADGMYAGRSAKVLRLTSSEAGQAGSAWSPTKIDPTKSFKTVFEVSAYQPVVSPGDGVAFVLQATDAQALGSTGGGLGYAGVKRSMIVEFDTFRNTLFDADNNHVAITTGGRSDTTLAVKQSPLPLFGAPFRGTVTYDAITQILRVYVNKLDGVGGGTRVLLKKVDLPAALGGTSPAFAGFTGATGKAASTQDILKWSVTVTQ